MKDRRTILVEKVFDFTSAAILLLSVALSALWLLSGTLPVEPWLAFLGLLYTVVPLLGRWTVRKVNGELRREAFTMPYALAYGYLTNYLAPLVRQLRKNAGSDAGDLRFYVYIPRSLEELSQDSIAEILDELEHRAYRIETVEIEFPVSKRRRDYRTALKLRPDGSADGTVKYFDFPTTLLTLEQAVEYKLDTREDSFPFEQRERLGQQYIEHFRAQLAGMLNTRKYETIRQNIRIVDGGYDFLDEDQHPVPGV